MITKDATFSLSCTIGSSNTVVSIKCIEDIAQEFGWNQHAVLNRGSDVQMHMYATQKVSSGQIEAISAMPLCKGIFLEFGGVLVLTVTEGSRSHVHMRKRAVLDGGKTPAGIGRHRLSTRRATKTTPSVRTFFKSRRR